MSRRHTVTASRRYEVDVPSSTGHRPEVSAEVRVAWPDGASTHQIEGAVIEATIRALDEVSARQAETAP